MTCNVCGKLVETDGDQNYEGTRAVHVPIEGLSVRCPGCGCIVHPECMVSGSDFCHACELVTT